MLHSVQMYWSRMLMQCSLSGIKYALKMEGLGLRRVEYWNMEVLISHIEYVHSSWFLVGSIGPRGVVEGQLDK